MAKLENELKPELAVIVYASEPGDNYYLETHVIREGRLMEGKPMKQKTIQAMVDVFYNRQEQESIISGVMPANLLSFKILPGGDYSMVWYQPACRKSIYFTNRLNIPSGEASVPAMLYKASGSSLYVYALNISDRPDESTKLYRAPYHNVASDGLVCLGSGKVKKPTVKTYMNQMKYWEDFFWLTEFSHLSGDNPTKSNLNILWMKLVKDKKLSWDTMDELKPSNPKSIKNLL